MQSGSYVQVIAATTGCFGAIFIVLGVVYSAANRRAGLLAIPWKKLSSGGLKKRATQKNLLESGLALVVLFILGAALPWVFNLPERRVLEGFYWIAIYAGVALGTIISLFLYGLVAAINERRLERRRR